MNGRRAIFALVFVLVALGTAIVSVPAVRRGLHARRTIAAALSDPDRNRRTEARREILGSEEAWAREVVADVAVAIVADAIADGPDCAVVVGESGFHAFISSACFGELAVTASLYGRLAPGSRERIAQSGADLVDPSARDGLYVLRAPDSAGNRWVVAEIPLRDRDEIINRVVASLAARGRTP